MKNIKLIFTLIIIFTLSGKVLQAGVFFEGGIYGYGNMTFSAPISNNVDFSFSGTEYSSYNTVSLANGGFGFEGGGLAQFGIFIDNPREYSGTSIMLEVGVQSEYTKYTTTVFEYLDTPVYDVSFTEKTTFATALTGFGVKMNFFDYASIGVFAGAKFVITSEKITRTLPDGSETYIEKTSASSVYPYVKVSLEYAIPINNLITIPVGLFFMFDGDQYFIDYVDNRTFSFALGIQTGVRFRAGR